jgi:pentatricopeptide repeat protein
MIESYATALYGSGILESAERALTARLATDGADVGALNTLAQVYRKQGRLDEARDLYERIVALDPTDWRAAALRAILRGETPLEYEAHDRLEPAPFVFIRDFLEPTFHQSLLPTVLSAGDENVTQSSVGVNEYRPDRRISYDIEGVKDIQRRVWDAVEAALPGVLPRLLIEPFTIERKEVRVRTYREGGFFDVHRDNSTPATEDRVVSFVYFFHRTPRRYTGGDLLFFDTNTFTNRNSGVTSFTRIEPTDNAIVFFPSRFFHAVVPVQCTSADPGDHRFVINGHIRSAGRI